VNGSTLKAQPVLVVRFGNSGNEISIDLHEHGAQPGIAVLSPVTVIPRELAGRGHEHADLHFSGYSVSPTGMSRETARQAK
jgi:hypothetical protein